MKVTVPILAGAFLAGLAGWLIAKWDGVSIAVAIWLSVGFTGLGFIEAIDLNSAESAKRGSV